MGKLNYSRCKCALWGFGFAVILGLLSLDIIQAMEMNPTNKLPYLNLLMTALIGVMVSFFVFWWGLEPIMPELKWGKDSKQRRDEL